MIRPETPADAPAVAALLTAAFGGPAEAGLVAALRAAGDAAIALVAEDDAPDVAETTAGAIVGHILLSPMQAPFPALSLAPLAVAPGRQGAGLGAALVRAALARAEAEGWRGVFVLGEPAYYGRFGFTADAAAGFESPYAGPAFQALALGGPLPARAGAAVHAPAFAALG